MQPDWTNPSYLRDGTPRQKEAYRVLESLSIFSTLREYTPLLAGTIPLDIDVASSDLDIICEAYNLTALADQVNAAYGSKPGFNLRRTSKDDLLVVLASFTHEGFAIEIFGQPRPVTEQNAYRHMDVEARLLKLGGERARQAIRSLKESGIKTEPAFAQYFGIPGDPYMALRDLYSATDEELQMRIEGDWNMTLNDVPEPFGYKMGWLAVRADSPAAVAEALPLYNTREARWKEGIDTVYELYTDDCFFITPSVQGWVLVVGLWVGSDIEETIIRLSNQFGEAQAFMTHRVSEDHHWLLARNGVLVRSYGYTGMNGEVTADDGEPTQAEIDLGYKKEPTDEENEIAAESHPDYMDDFWDDFWWRPNEQTVMDLAGRWSVDPTSLGPETASSGKGLLSISSSEPAPEPTNEKPPKQGFLKSLFKRGS